MESNFFRKKRALIGDILKRIIGGDIVDNPFAIDGEDEGELWRKLLSVNWGYKFIEGDLDGYPDAHMSIELSRLLTEEEQSELRQMVEEWHDRGFKEVNAAGSEFGGSMHYMGDVEFNNNKVLLYFDFGSVNTAQAFSFILQRLSDWNNGRIVKFTFGRDDYVPEI